jgi:hypothetical protein
LRFRHFRPARRPAEVSRFRGVHSSMLASIAASGIDTTMKHAGPCRRRLAALRCWPNIVKAWRQDALQLRRGPDHQPTGVRRIPLVGVPDGIDTSGKHAKLSFGRRPKTRKPCREPCAVAIGWSGGPRRLGASHVRPAQAKCRGAQTERVPREAVRWRDLAAMKVLRDRLFVAPGNDDIDRKVQAAMWKGVRSKIVKDPRTSAKWMASALRVDARCDEIQERQEAHHRCGQG